MTKLPIFEPYLRLLHFDGNFRSLIEVVQRNLARIDELGDDPRAVLIQHHYAIALVFNGRYREAAAVPRKMLPMAERLGDSRSNAYALSAELFTSTTVAPKTLDEFQDLRKKAIHAACDTNDPYIASTVRWHVGWEELHRGRMSDARELARELIQVGQNLNDPRTTGFGLVLLMWIAITSDAYEEALEISEQIMAVAVTPLDRAATNAKGCALVLLRRIDEGAVLLEEVSRRCVVGGSFYLLNSNAPLIGLVEILRGNIGEGVRLIEDGISRLDKDGYKTVADWNCLNLAEVYLQVIAGTEKPPLLILLKNLPTILMVVVTASSRIRALIASALENLSWIPKDISLAVKKSSSACFTRPRESER